MPRPKKKAGRPKTVEKVSRAELAKLGGRSRSAVTQACKPGGALYAAVVPGGVNVLHPDTQSWLSDAPSEGLKSELSELLLAKRREEVRRLRLANDEAEGTLISRELVRTHVFGLIDGCFQRLLHDLPRTATARLYAAARGNESREVAERMVRELIMSTLEPARVNAMKALRKKRTKNATAS